MKSYKYNFIMFISVATTLFFCRCSDIIQTDLSNTDVKVTVPANNLHTTKQSITFMWEKVEGATRYHFQMVSPDFDNASNLIADTTISYYRFKLTLAPGTYQWKIKALNESSFSRTTIHTLFVDSAISLSDAEVVLFSPGNASGETYVTSQQKIMFKWYTVENAENYIVEIHSPDWGGAMVTNPKLTLNDTIWFTLDEGYYSWGVQARNTTSSTPFSTRNIIIDKTSPLTPILIFPAINEPIHDTSLTNSTITLRWSRPSDSGSQITDSIYIASDSLFSYNSMKLAATSIDTFYSYKLTSTGNFFWKIRSIDKAGNKSPYSVKRKFVFYKLY